jgi:hypothetical protein
MLLLGYFQFCYLAKSVRHMTSLDQGLSSSEAILVPRASRLPEKTGYLPFYAVELAALLKTSIGTSMAIEKLLRVQRVSPGTSRGRSDLIGRWK